MIKVIIERKVMPECIEQYEKNVLDVHQIIFEVTGFISHEALINIRDPNHRYVIVNFDNIHNWTQWYKSDKRQEAVAEIMQMLEEPEKISILEYLIRV